MAIRKAASSRAAPAARIPEKTGAAGPWAAQARALDGARDQVLRHASVKVQLAVLGDGAPEGDDWLHELKYDGFRLSTTIVAGTARMWSRNGLEWTRKVPRLVAALESLGLDSAVFDGEMIVGRGRQEDFNALQASLGDADDTGRVYAIFDVLHLDGVSVADAPLAERKALLEAVLKGAPDKLAYSSHVVGSGPAVFERASADKFEGIISKRADAPYRPGRNDDWLKAKRQETDEFAVVGFTLGKGKREGKIGSLLLARPDGDGCWQYAGRVGSGFGGEVLAELAKLIGRAGRAENTVPVPKIARAAVRDAKWFEPRFVVEVFLRGVGTSGIVRQASFKAIRDDKSIADLRDSDHLPR